MAFSYIQPVSRLKNAYAHDENITQIIEDLPDLFFGIVRYIYSQCELQQGMPRRAPPADPGTTSAARALPRGARPLPLAAHARRRGAGRRIVALARCNHPVIRRLAPPPRFMTVVPQS